MRSLETVRPSSEQLIILARNTLGVEIIRGAAGSGKTTTSLLRLRTQIGSFRSRRERQSDTSAISILILTYNRTLRGYINDLIQDQVVGENVEILVSTFGKWAIDRYESAPLIPKEDREKLLNRLALGVELDRSFLLEEIEYIIGRFKYDELSSYLVARRDGRGISPRVPRILRQKILDQIIFPYYQHLNDTGQADWNLLALHFSENSVSNKYDVIIVDEAQDFSANQVRAVLNQTKEVFSATFVLDTAQRIYANSYTWSEVGLEIRPENVCRLKRNYRNTRQIAALAAALVDGVPLDDDGTLPDLTKTNREGDLPLLLRGSYSAQVNYVIQYISRKINLTQSSVAFLHPKGWFNYLKPKLKENGIDFISLTRQSDWPDNDTNVGLSTIHSVKGLEFDYVIMLGINEQVTPHGEGEEDQQLQSIRRLLAMGIGRAKKNVIIGTKPSEESQALKYLTPDLYDEVTV